MVPGTTSSSGYIEIYKSNATTRLGYIGFDNTNLSYVAENGAIHSFSGGNLVSENEVYAGTNKWFRVRGNTGIYWENYGGGWFMQDTVYMRTQGEKSIYTGVGSILTSTGTIQAGSGIGSAKLIPGGPSNSGYVGIFRADNTRLGYIGFDNNNLSYYSENGANHVFSGGSIYADNQIYSGINQWFRVRGSGTGVYWENFGGGWYMDETSTIKSVNSKNIYTGGAITAGSDIVGNAQVYAGINQYFRVRGDGGFYFDNYGGGWNMTDTTWIRAMNNKNIYTGGVGRFDTRVETARVQGTSDKRFKKDIAKIYDATEKLNQLNGYTYTWRDKKEFPGQPLGEGKDMGVIAQEVEKVFPDAVMTNKEGYKSVNYNALIPVLIEALKESNQKIKALEDRLNKVPVRQAAQNSQALQ